MVRMGGFVMFESEKEFDENVITMCDNSTRFSSGIIYKPEKFPAFFAYFEATEAHFCGDWKPCLPISMIQDVMKRISYQQNLLLDILNALQKEDD